MVNGEKPTSQELEELAKRGIEIVSANAINTYDSIKVFEAAMLYHEQPSRHDSSKLARALIQILKAEKPSWNLYFTLYTEEGFKNLKLVRLMNTYKERKRNAHRNIDDNGINHSENESNNQAVSYRK